ncbi:MAG: hypothetical protein HY301_12900 [Verrucomicrobia bacterium]|nr:hypothetical protein [Verrucomicrobiota bacterium]
MRRLICQLILAAASVLSALDTPAQIIFTKPNPAKDDQFGKSVAAVGSDGILIGAPGDSTGAGGAGAAYLFGINGTLATTFTNPTPANGDGFGFSVAAMGSDRVLIGAPSSTDAGTAYLLSTNGTLLTSFTNPTPANSDYFGWLVVAVGSDRVLVGAPNDSSGAGLAGAAYLFGTNGILLTTFTNPTPAGSDHFGNSLAAVGSDRVLIGAHGDDTGATFAGTAYLFTTNGTLLTTFTNPTPENFDQFGWSVAAMGSDQVLIGTPDDNTGATNAGSAYLFSTNGTLLTSFTNPTPVAFDAFGISVAAVGSNRVLIGSFRDHIGASEIGAAYLFSTDGTLLTTFTNPTPANGDKFGFAVAAVDNDRVIIGAFFDNQGAPNGGVAYLFNIPPPRLNLTLSGTNSSISWVTDELGWVLQETKLIDSPPVWSATTNQVSTNGLTNFVQLPLPDGVTDRFYRLRRP